MSRRGSTGWLIGGIALLTGLGLAAALIPIRACRSCDGLALHLHQLTSPVRGTVPLPRIDCPDCGDRGKVSLFRSWMRPRVSVTIAAVLRELKGASERRPEGLAVHWCDPATSRLINQATAVSATLAATTVHPEM